MKHDPSGHPPVPPPVLEQLGALGSLLVHDLANQMCVIAGNATFAQMMLDDPTQAARSIDAIVKASERVNEMLARCADLRRRLGEGIPKGEAATAVALARQAVAASPGWTFDVAGTLAGPLQIPDAWVAFAVSQVIQEAGAASGTVRAMRVAPDHDTGFIPPGGAYLEFRLTWESPENFSLERVRERYQNFGLMAAFELLRQCGGRLEGFTPAPGRQEALVVVAFAAAPRGTAPPGAQR